MKKIEALLGRFKDLDIPDKEVRMEVSAALLKIINTEIDIKNISIKRRIAYIKSDSSLRSEIFMNKNKILALLSLRGVAIDNLR